MPATLPHLLEIGPGSRPLVLSHWDEYDWQIFPNGIYTAIQPSPSNTLFSFHPSFPESCLGLPGVTFIEDDLENHDFNGQTFDEVYAANVFSDPSAVNKRSMLKAIIEITSQGSLFTLYDTSTPEYSVVNPEALERLFPGTFEPLVSIKVTEKSDDLLMGTASEEWIEHVGPYSYHVRQAAEYDMGVLAGTFQQYVRL